MSLRVQSKYDCCIKSKKFTYTRDHHCIATSKSGNDATVGRCLHPTLQRCKITK